ncbi:zinc-dependent MarR family transcriptional regulator [Streptococcus ferus]|uniref:zinc-dependent MarR family transcriptional regulator n=1 Tax=Streptococcus ferus TaxID=1345 RepID=UPI00359F4543
MQISEKIDSLIHTILQKAENQRELLIGACQSDVKLTNTQEHILMLLANENLTNTDLAKRLNLTQAAMTKAVKSLVQQGMLETIKNQSDARQTYFKLTDLAMPIAQEHAYHHSQTLAAYDRVLEAFDDKETQVIDRFIGILKKELGE